MEENSYKKSLWRVSPSYSPPSFFVHLVYEFLHKNFINFHKYIQYMLNRSCSITLILISLKNVNTFEHKAWNFVQFFFDLEYFWYILKNLIKLFFQYILHNTYMSKAKFFDKFQTFLEAKLCFNLWASGLFYSRAYNKNISWFKKLSPKPTQSLAPADIVTKTLSNSLSYIIFR